MFAQMSMLSRLLKLSLVNLNVLRMNFQALVSQNIGYYNSFNTSQIVSPTINT